MRHQILAGFAFLAAGAAGAGPAMAAPIAAWSEINGANYGVYASTQSDGKWSAPALLSDGGANSVAPAVATAPDGTGWVVWSQIDDAGNGHLYYSHTAGDGWTAPQPIPVPVASATGPSLVFAPDGSAWLAFAGDDGNGDEIYVLHVNGATVEGPYQLGTPDATPDLQPLIGLDANGQPWVSWSGFDAGRYQTFVSSLAGRTWKAEARLPTVTLDELRQAYAGGGGLAAALRARVLAAVNGELWVRYTSAAGRERLARLALSAAANGRVKLDLSRQYDLPSLAQAGIKAQVASFSLASGAPSIRVSAASTLPAKTVTRAATAGVTRFAGMGDSITAGSPIAAPSFPGDRAGGYEPTLESLLNNSGRPSYVLNYGVSGETTAEGVGRIGGVLADSAAQYVLILEGTNDEQNGISIRSTLFNLFNMVGQGYGAGAIPVLGTIPPDTKYGYRTTVAIYNWVILVIAQYTGYVAVADHFSALNANWGALTSDGRHPNAAGYNVMANVWFGAIP